MTGAKMREQEELLNHITAKYHLSDEVIEAYRQCSRHKFIKRPYSLYEIYSDYPLEIYRDENFISTISQPSFVLLMIDMLKLAPHHKVLELGAGSGWNAALMSKLSDLVVSIEIIPSLAKETKKNLAELGFKNVIIIEGDGALGCKDYAPYDRGIFTAGATDLPKAFHEQIRPGGLLLFVLKTAGVDLLLLLMKKNESFFEEIKRIPCSFVPMMGLKKAVFENMSDVSNLKGTIRISPSSEDGTKDSVISVV